MNQRMAPMVFDKEFPTESLVDLKERIKETITEAEDLKYGFPDKEERVQYINYFSGIVESIENELKKRCH